MFLKSDLVIWSLLALVLLVLLVLGFVIWVASRPEKENRDNSRRLVKMRNDSLRASFRQAIELIEANIADRSQRLSLPWVLVLNEGLEPEPIALGHSGIAQALSADSTASASSQGISWNFFDKGIVINMLGAYLGSPDNDDDSERPWEEFLNLCRDYRPERPFDSLVVTVPVDLLMSSDPNARLELNRLAKVANRRLWKAQNRFAMRFSVYVMVSGCERLTGFAPFARALPEPMRKSILGWSSPFEITATYQDNWVDQAVDHTVQTLSDTSAELYVLNVEGDSSPYFLLPGQIDNLRPQLQLYVNELMRPSTYHEPFLMRGIYFTGDAGEVAERALSTLDSEDFQAQQIGADDPMADAPNAEGAGAADAVPTKDQATDADSPSGRGLALSPRALDAARQSLDKGNWRAEPSPVFLRDLFEQKIFAEYGLARPSGSQLTSRPMLGRGARWATLTLMGCWSLGLLTGSVILHKQSDAVHSVLLKFKQDNDQRALAIRNGETISAEVQNRRALALLGVMEQMDSKRLWSVFMPGSWPVVDSLSDDLRQYLERAFGDIAAATLQRALHTKVSQLTGVPQDNSTGELIQGASCTSLNTNAVDLGRPVQLGFQELPEFAALLTYVSQVEQTDLAYGALQRLQTPGLPPNPLDLQLLVKLVFGTELATVSQRSSELFRSKAASEHKVQLAPVQDALRCGLRQRSLVLQEAAFDNNPLLLRQRDLNASVNSLTEAVETSGDGKAQLDLLTSLMSDIKAHEAMLAAGASYSAWMRRPNFAPGASWDTLLARLNASQLLGPNLALLTKEKFDTAYKSFSIELNDLLSENPNTEVVWDDKEMRYRLGNDLSSLRMGMAALMAEPYMATSNNMPAPDLNNLDAKQGLNWDLPRLDEALATQDQRKKFKSDILSRFPVSSHRAITQIVNSRLSNQVMTHVNAALTSGTKASGLGADSSTLDAERTRLNRVQSLLADLGARREGDALRALINRDALRKLQALDESLNRAELYAAKGRSFAFWQGEKSPALGAFGLPDASSLQSYLAQQMMRAEQLSKDADGVISLLNRDALNSNQVQRWQALSKDLERFKLKNPNSSLLGLEQFIVAMAGDVDAQNCQERLQGKVPNGRPADFFAERHAQLASSLSLRCNELKSKEQFAQWSVFTNDFNQTLAGRPPFAAPGWAAEAPMVELEEIATLFRTYERARPAMQALIQNQKGAATTAPVQRFVDQFDRSRSFMAPLVAAEENAPVGYDVAVEFRANQGAEVQGNQVIDWTLVIGRQRLSLRDVPKPLRWEPGLPITLTLRFAKDGQAVPQPDPKQPALSVDGKTVTLRYADAWSLFNLIGRQRENEARGDGRSQLLRLEFPLLMESLPALGTPTTAKAPTPTAVVAASTTPPLASESRAKVYLRLTLSPPGKRNPLIWPGPLPTRAPEPIKP